MKIFDLKKGRTTHPIQLSISSYSRGNNLAIEIIAFTIEDPKTWGMLTVNLDGRRNINCAFIDTNNNGNEILAWIIRHGLAAPTGHTARSGFYEYPEYCFKPLRLEECDSNGYADYLQKQEEK